MAPLTQGRWPGKYILAFEKLQDSAPIIETMSTVSSSRGDRRGRIDRLTRHRFSGIVDFRTPVLTRKLRIFPIRRLMCLCPAVHCDATTQTRKTYIRIDLFSTWARLIDGEIGHRRSYFPTGVRKERRTANGPRNGDRKKRDRRRTRKWELKARSLRNKAMGKRGPIAQVNDGGGFYPKKTT